MSKIPLAQLVGCGRRTSTLLPYVDVCAGTPSRETPTYPVAGRRSVVITASFNPIGGWSLSGRAEMRLRYAIGSHSRRAETGSEIIDLPRL
jgi:hypothetical protein